MSEIEEASKHLLRVVEILRGFDKRLKNLEGDKVNTEGLDLNQLTEEVANSIRDNVVSEVASCIDLSAVAEEIDKNEIVTDVAEYFGAEGIAEHVNVDQVAEHVELDYEKVVQGLIKAFMKAEEDA